jgi:hypothetical protein
MRRLWIGLPTNKLGLIHISEKLLKAAISKGGAP